MNRKIFQLTIDAKKCFTFSKISLTVSPQKRPCVYDVTIWRWSAGGRTSLTGIGEIKPIYYRVNKKIRSSFIYPNVSVSYNVRVNVGVTSVLTKYLSFCKSNSHRFGMARG